MPSDKVYLKINESAPQVFNFDVIFASQSDKDAFFFSSTEEGALWGGTVDKTGAITTIGYEIISGELGSTLCICKNQLAVTSYDLQEFIYDSAGV
ncbi:MAG: hypothetical protein LBD85_05360 [Oscillospiraceae bacterium]|nr:hypothetical protein [Oscillospiraceae bacterium]